MEVNSPLVIPLSICHSDLFGIILKKDAGQASMTEKEIDSRLKTAGMTEGVIYGS
jgi:hypothetical protein